MYNQIDGIIFVIDGSDLGRLSVVKELLKKLFNEISEKIPVSILVNKFDLNNCINKSLLQSYLELDLLDTKFNWQILNSISYSLLGVKESVKFILSKI